MDVIAIVSKLAGVQVELTIRGDKEFTFSTFDRNDAAAERIASYFRSNAQVEVEHDDECGSFVYVTAH